MTRRFKFFIRDLWSHKWPGLTGTYIGLYCKIKTKIEGVNITGPLVLLFVEIVHCKISVITCILEGFKKMGLPYQLIFVL